MKVIDIIAACEYTRCDVYNAIGEKYEITKENMEEIYNLCVEHIDAENNKVRIFTFEKLNEFKADMSNSCRFKYVKYWMKANHYKTMSQNEWYEWYSKNCWKCKYMGEVCMYGEK